MDKTPLIVGIAVTLACMLMGGISGARRARSASPQELAAMRKNCAVLAAIRTGTLAADADPVAARTTLRQQRSQNRHLKLGLLLAATSGALSLGLGVADWHTWTWPGAAVAIVLMWCGYAFYRRGQRIDAMLAQLDARIGEGDHRTADRPDKTDSADPAAPFTSNRKSNDDLA